jgi:predicted nucleic acid-binding protein
LRSVLVNSGPLMALGKLNRLGLLALLYPDLRVPQAVYREVVIEGTARSMPEALTVRLFLEHLGLPLIGVSEGALARYAPRVVLGAGEREVLTLARSLPGALVLLDDEQAKTEARSLGLAVKGTVGILVEAHRTRLLPLGELRLLFAEIAARPDIWISAKLCQQVLFLLEAEQESR